MDLRSTLVLNLTSSLTLHSFSNICSLELDLNSTYFRLALISFGNIAIDMSYLFTAFNILKI